MFSRRWRFFFLLAWIVLLGAQKEPPDQPRFSSPLPGSAVQGSVSIGGSTDLPDFQSAEVSFSYISSQPDNWFLIQQLRSPQKDGMLAVWDTTTIADGNYRLRLQVFLTNGKMVEVFISGLRVRNYTAVETSTPTNPSEQVATSMLRTVTPIQPTATLRNTPSPLPPNPAQIHPSNLALSAGVGVGVILLTFILIAIYQSFRFQGKP